MPTWSAVGRGKGQGMTDPDPWATYRRAQGLDASPPQPSVTSEVGGFSPTSFTAGSAHGAFRVLATTVGGCGLPGSHSSGSAGHSSGVAAGVQGYPHFNSCSERNAGSTMPGVFPGNQPMSPMNACGAMPAYPAGTPMSFAPSQGVGLPTMGMTGTYPPQASQQTPMGPPHMSGPSQRVSQPCNMGMPQTSNIPQGNFSQFGAAAFASALDAGSVPQQQQEFPSAFSVLGKTVPERSQNPENSCVVESTAHGHHW